jgi:hypothetical protein
MSSAAGVVGPLAPSTTMLAAIAPALASVIWFSTAAGTRNSQGSAPEFLGGERLAPAKPFDAAAFGRVMGASAVGSMPRLA